MKSSTNNNNFWGYFYISVILILIFGFIYFELLSGNYWSSASNFQKIGLVSSIILICSYISFSKIKNQNNKIGLLIGLIVILSFIFTVVSSFWIDTPMPKDQESVCAEKYCL